MRGQLSGKTRFLLASVPAYGGARPWQPSTSTFHPSPPPAPLGSGQLGRCRSPLCRPPGRRVKMAAAEGCTGASGSCSSDGALTHFAATVGRHCAARAGECRAGLARQGPQPSGSAPRRGPQGERSNGVDARGAGRSGVGDTNRAFLAGGGAWRLPP